jgi:hypothetical protein
MGSRTDRDIAAITRENRSRRAAARRGLALSKIRRRDPAALGYGRWVLATPRGRVLLGDAHTGAALDEVETYLGVTP